MSAQTELFALLDADAALSALVSDRIYPHAVPENRALPAVVYALASTQRNVGLDLSDHGTALAFSISSAAEDHTTATAVGDAVESALLVAGVPADNRYAGFDEETGNFVDVIEITWWE